MTLAPGTRMQNSAEIDQATATGAPRVVVPVTTNIITLDRTQTCLYVSPVGTIAALTIQLPVNPPPGAVVDISFSQIVTALTIQSGEATAVASTAGAVGVGHQYRYINATTGWVRWR